MDKGKLRMLQEDLRREARQFETWRSGLVDMMHDEYGISNFDSCATSFKAITLCINRSKMELLEAASKIDRILESDAV